MSKLIKNKHALVFLFGGHYEQKLKHKKTSFNRKITTKIYHQNIKQMLINVLHII